MKIIQLTESITFGDAITNHIFAIDKTLKINRQESYIYASDFKMDKRFPTEIKRKSKLKLNLHKDDIIVYHLSIGTDLTEWFKNLQCKKGIIYHNITPSKFYKKYNYMIYENTKYGRETLSTLCNHIDFAIANSDYSKQELINLGYKNVYTIPLLISFSEYNKPLDNTIIDRFSDNKKNILFVGRIVPNKKIEDIIIAYDYYKKNLNHDCRLILVGDTVIDAYFSELEELIKDIQATDVIFTGLTSFAELITYYKIADLFLCMSEHEGFCVPLVESMYFDIPILAYNSSAIPETLGDSGIIFNRKEFDKISFIIDVLLNNSDLRQKIVDSQQKRLESFDNKIIEDKLLKIFNNI